MEVWRLIYLFNFYIIGIDMNFTLRRFVTVINGLIIKTKRELLNGFQ